jgi:hypothetical protein
LSGIWLACRAANPAAADLDNLQISRFAVPAQLSSHGEWPSRSPWQRCAHRSVTDAPAVPRHVEGVLAWLQGPLASHRLLPAATAAECGSCPRFSSAMLGAAQLHGHAQLLGEDVDAVPYPAPVRSGQSRTGTRARPAPGRPAPPAEAGADQHLQPVPSWPRRRLFPCLPNGPSLTAAPGIAGAVGMAWREWRWLASSALVPCWQPLVPTGTLSLSELFSNKGI